MFKCRNLLLRQYAFSPGNMAYCYAELTISSLAVAGTIVSTYCAYPRTMARLSRPAWLIKYQDGISRESSNSNRTIPIRF